MAHQIIEMIDTRPHMPPQMSSPPSSTCSSSTQNQEQLQRASTNSSFSTMISPIFNELISYLHLVNNTATDDETQISHLRQLRHQLDQLQNALRAIVESNGTLMSGKDGENLNVNDTTTAADALDIIALPVLDILQHEHWFTIEQNRNQHKQQRYCSNVNALGGGRDRDDGGERCSTKETTDMIRRSVSYSCMEKAAISLISLWTLRQRTSITTTTIIDDSAWATSTKGITDQFRSSVHKLVLPSLISCAMALSSLDIAGEAEDVGNSFSDDDVAGTSTAAVELATGTTRPSTTTSISDEELKKTTQRQSLDRGEDCAMAILSCIQSFLHFDANASIDNADDDIDYGLSSSQHHAEVGVMEEDGVASPQHLLSHEVGSAMRGALVARLVQGCLSLLSSPMTSDSAARKKDDTALQLEALKTLRSLLINVPSPELWKSILPGTFATLYQMAMSRLQSLSSSMYSPSSSSFKTVASASVRVLSLLLDKSLGSEPRQHKDNEHHEKQQQARNVIDKDNNIQSITASLMAAVQQSSVKIQPLGTANKEDGGPLSPDTANSMPLPLPGEDEKKLQELKTEVNNRLVGPLLVLLSLLPTNRCKNVQKSGLYLSQTIMICVRSIWTESNYKALERKALEFCLMMMVGDEGDDDVELKRFSYNILHSYKTINYGEGWRKQLSQTIVPTILELMEPLPTFARSRREMQVRHNLQLIDGYLLISFRSMLKDGDFDVDWWSSEKKRKSDIGHAISCTEALKIVKHTFSGELLRMHAAYDR